MAKTCFSGGGNLCAYFVIISGVAATIAASNDDYYLYDIGSNYHQSQYSMDLNLLKDYNDRRIVKRNVQPDKDTLILQKPETEDMQTKLQKIRKSYRPAIPTHSLITPKNVYNNTNNKQQQQQQELLGFNGTGQRKIMQSDLSLSSPIITSTTTTITTSSTVTTPTTKVALMKNLMNNSPNLETVFKNNETIARNNQTINHADIENYDDDDNDDNISITKFYNNENETLSKHHIIMTKTDNHLYYNSTLNTDITIGRSLWVNLTNRKDVKTNELLSQSHRRAVTVKLKFDFPFYGHLIKNVTIATGGFLYTGDYVHSWLAATQYIAPLMGNFDTSISNKSTIKYADNGTAFTVEWDRVSLQDRPSDGEFTFQTTLHKNGDIVFVYQNVPIIIEKIEDDYHPVKVGLSDAYIIDRTIFFVRRKTIYEYHRVNFFKSDVKNWTSIYLKALPTCLDSKDCITCLTHRIPTFNCSWCPTINRCSNGLDRHRQDWLTKNCDKKQLINETMCSHVSGSDIFNESDTSYIHDSSQFEQKIGNHSKLSNRLYNGANVQIKEPVKMGVSSVVAIFFLIAMVAGLSLWTLYAYRNPHTFSGQMLIRYRPSQWKWRRGEARYTAATIHM